MISDANETGGEILMVNFTTLRHHTFDQSCILDPVDYSELTRPSVIAFAGSHTGPEAALEKAIQQGDFSAINPGIPAVGLQKIIAVARDSSALSPAKKRLLPRA